ncbi:multicopper oxidase domain-containing protein [Paenibacillus sp. CMAA1739]|uniref:multicopper oxidase family protein n=1 Tax=Paenibacillus ottowii TaxID=2315729 RepID=UPI002730D21C|nr:MULTISPECIES: multicopper oxidase domain-containing protein [Paenibacillus]MDP1513386.1 multicopper oxidase domain-containing protein [Paenibacillus ottowii]MEC4569372.1 multicopper oxidase domain-containing protein [Paenibacillus sp. CMAA1739]
MKRSITIWAVTAILYLGVVITGYSVYGSRNDSKDQSMDMAGMNHSSMNMGEMDPSSMDISHESVTALKSSLGINELTFPKLLKPDLEDTSSVAYTIRAQQGTYEIYDGTQTKTYGYNGDFLGPVIRLKQGMNVTFHLVNDLKENTTFHWHGLEAPGDVDGGPEPVLKRGQERTISFKVDQEAATLWFHPHPSPNTAEQVYKGLAGMIYIEDTNSEALEIPKTYGVDDLPIILQDKAFTADKQLDYAKAMNADGTTGETLLINGVADPELTIDRKQVRLRILNGSNMRSYKLHLDNNMEFQQIASDGGFLNKPNTITEIEMAPSERVEVIVDLTKVKGNKISLINDDNTKILPIHLKDTEELPQSTQEVKTLNNAAITDEIKNKKVTKKFKLAGMGKETTINGKKFDPNRIDFTQKQGETEVWEVENVKDSMGGMNHPFHIHGTQFQVISINGKEPPENLSGYKDTISLQPGQTAKIAVTFHKNGVYMFHCHILEHEDSGMMGQVMVD